MKKPLKETLIKIGGGHLLKENKDLVKWLNKEKAKYAGIDDR